MEIPLNVKVECKDGLCGRSVYVLIDPVVDEVVHLVVREDSSPNTEYIGPVDLVDETTKDTIQLRCSKVELEKMDPFLVTKYIEDKLLDINAGFANMYGMGNYYYLPYVTSEKTIFEPVTEKQIPPGELAVSRGTRVEATNGFVGKVDEFVINPENSHISHFVMREGHLWGQKDVIIPVSAIKETRADTVFLKLDKLQIESLRTYPIHRRWS